MLKNRLLVSVVTLLCVLIDKITVELDRIEQTIRTRILDVQTSAWYAINIYHADGLLPTEYFRNS